MTRPFKTPDEDPDAWDGYDNRPERPNTAFTDECLARLRRMMAEAPKAKPSAASAFPDDPEPLTPPSL